MAKKLTHQVESILPTEYESSSDIVLDPRGHEEKIAEANQLLSGFVKDLSAASLDQVRQAASLIGDYAGYPKAAFEMDCWLESDFANQSYRAIADSLPSFQADMNFRIQKRVELLSAPKTSTLVLPHEDVVGKQDCPF